jgi:hypothetical protein
MFQAWRREWQFLTSLAVNGVLSSLCFHQSPV